MPSTKRLLTIFSIIVLTLSLLLIGCGPEEDAEPKENDEMAEEEKESENDTEANGTEELEPLAWTPSTQSLDFEDGTYRGTFFDSGEMQVNVQFELENNEITEASYRHLAYSGDDYLESDDDTIQGLREQHKELLEYLEGADIRTALADLYEPGEIVESEVDGFTGATMRANKVAYAFRDGLNRGVYSFDEKPEGYSNILGENYEDGTYRGVFSDGGEMQVNVQFTLDNHEVTDIEFRHLAYSDEDYLDTDDETIEGLREQHEMLIDHLESSDIRDSLADLYYPGEIVDEEHDVDGFTGATLRSTKIVSAIKDGLDKGVYSNDVAEGYSPLPGQSFEDGTYRGVFSDSGEMQVNTQFTLEDNIITDISFRHLYYGGEDYLEAEDETVEGLKEQHEMLIDHLEGTDIRVALTDLYEPGEIVTEEYDVDGFTGATLRSSKIIHSIVDGLNKGLYTLP